MSRIGKLPISIPAGVTVTLKDDVVMLLCLIRLNIRPQ